jgi:hypothetical protein
LEGGEGDFSTVVGRPFATETDFEIDQGESAMFAVGAEKKSAEQTSGGQAGVPGQKKK